MDLSLRFPSLCRKQADVETEIFLQKK